MPTNGRFDPIGVYAIMSRMVWALTIIVALGVANFAMHRAVMDRSTLPLGQMPDFLVAVGGRLALGAEFAVLLLALLLAANGWPELVWAYLAYSLLNAISAWLILSGRI